MFERSIFVRHPRFTDAEFSALQELWTRHRATRQGFTDQELTHLRFMHWLVRRPEWNRILDQPAGGRVST